MLTKKGETRERSYGNGGRGKKKKARYRAVILLTSESRGRTKLRRECEEGGRYTIKATFSGG